MRPRRPSIARARALLPILTCLVVASPADAQSVRPAQVRRAIDAAIGWLRRARQADATWPYENEMFRTGADALAALALLSAGVAADDPDVAPTLVRLASARNDYTYNIALKIAALARADPARYRISIERAARQLLQDQLKSGAWTYAGGDIRVSLQRGDHSNTQFALYGLDEAARAGVRIDPAVWKKSAAYWESCQRPDGGWGYTPGDGRSYGSMTAAGVASLIICGNSAARSLEHGYRDGAAEGCGRYATNRFLASGLNWLGRNIDVRSNPNHPSYHFYWLYALERVGMLSGLRFLGPHDWYREGASYLVSTQRADGSWNGMLVDTCFGLLFLAKGREPVLINKLAWSRDQRWNLDRDDCKNLVAFLGDKLGETVAWQSIPLDASVEDWLAAPILYFNGHTFPPFATREIRAKLRRYVEAGGTILAEACCSRRDFAAGFERFAAELFPEQPLVELGPEHPVWDALFDLAPGNFRLKGLDLGCRTSVLFVPTDLSCLWQQADESKLTREAFELGANLAAYATGREPLRDKLERIALPVAGSEEAEAKAAPGALRLVQLIHAGDWKPDAHAMERLTEMLRESAGVDVVSRPLAIPVDDARLLEHPIAYMSGHRPFALEAAQVAALRRYLERGGFLFADACCGREPFDRSFRAMCRQLFPDRPLTRLDAPPRAKAGEAANGAERARADAPPALHPLIRANPGFDLSVVHVRPTLQREQPGLTTPVLESVALDGRIVIVYSRYGFTCGLENHACYHCRGYAPEDARKLAANIVLYALTR